MSANDNRYAEILRRVLPPDQSAAIVFVIRAMLRESASTSPGVDFERDAILRLAAAGWASCELMSTSPETKAAASDGLAIVQALQRGWRVAEPDKAQYETERYVHVSGAVVRVREGVVVYEDARGGEGSAASISKAMGFCKTKG